MVVLRRAVVMLVVLLAAGTGRAEPTVLRFGQIPSTARGIAAVVHYIGEQQGFFARQNIVIALKQIPGGTDRMVAALDRGEVEVTQTATPYLIQAVLAGSDAAAIAGGVANPVYSLLAKPQIQAFGDLKGKLIGLSLPIDTISISTRKLLALKGLADADYRVKELVGTPLRAACLRSGECDAVPLGQPDDFIAIKDGYRRLGLSTEAVTAFQFEVIAARRSYAAAHAGVLSGFVRALAESFRFIRDPAHRPEVIQAIVAVTGSPPEAARQTMALYFEPERGVLPRQAEIDLPGLEQVIVFMAEAGTIRPPLPAPERFVDLQYLAAAGIK